MIHKCDEGGCGGKKGGRGEKVQKLLQISGENRKNSGEE
jgi:hypothetical protein